MNVAHEVVVASRHSKELQSVDPTALLRPSSLNIHSSSTNTPNFEISSDEDGASRMNLEEGRKFIPCYFCVGELLLSTFMRRANFT